MDGRLTLALAALLAGCASLPDSLRPAPAGPQVAVQRPGPDTLRPRARPGGAAAAVAAEPAAQLGRSGQSAERLDTTTAEERAEATAAPAGGGETRLGTTVASLGDPTEQGLWLETPLVTGVREGRIVRGGASVKLELRPSGGAAGSGSRISLAAMRLLGASLTDLPEVEVFGL